MKKSIYVLLTAAALSMALTACSSGKAESKGEAAQTQVETQADADAEKHLKVAFFWVSADLDPANSYNGWVTCRLGVGESLVRLNDDLEVEGLVADTWENIDPLTWEFHVREGVTFSNGKAVTAEEVKASIERAISMNSRAADYLKIESMVADGQTLTIKTTEPNAALLNNMVEPVFNIIDVTQDEEGIQNAPVCTGPYIVQEFVSEQKVELVKNENYWQGEVGLDSITVTQISDADARAMAIQSGEVQLTNTIDNTSVKIFADTEKYNVSSIISPRVNVAYMNNGESSPLHDIELRKAVSYAVNREAYAQLIGGTAAHSFYSDATPFGNENIQAISYDLDEAVRILDAAGYVDVDGDGYRDQKDGSELILNYLQSADHGSADSAILATAVQSDLKAIGVHMEILAVENLSDYQTQGNFDFYTANDNSAPTGDPQIMLEIMYTGLATEGKKNLTSFQDDRIDAIVEKMRTTFDIQERYDLAQQASQILNDDAANLFLTNSYLNMVSSIEVKNAIQCPADYYFITKDITVE